MSETGTADDTIPMNHSTSLRETSNGFNAYYSPGTRVSFAVYSVKTDGNKSYQEVTVVAP